MKILYTCISGLQEIARAALMEKKGHRVLKMMDGALLCEAERPSRAGCFNNTFEVLLERSYSGAGALDKLMSEAVRLGMRGSLSQIRGKVRTFRIVSSLENKLTSVDSRRKAELEKLIAARTGLRVERALADVEFWLYGRSEGIAFFLRRLSYERVTEKQLQKGELRPELCWCMNYLSSPSPRDVFLDPFAGSGAIPHSRLKMGSFAKLYALDIDRDKAKAIARRLGNAENVHVQPLPIAQIDSRIEPGSITKVVTDPPWGFFEEMNVPAFYADMWKHLLPICAQDARIVMLSARADEMERILMRMDTLAVEAIYRVLVNGKKAGIYVMRRT